MTRWARTRTLVFHVWVPRVEGECLVAVAVVPLDEDTDRGADVGADVAPVKVQHRPRGPTLPQEAVQH